jgi:hypothetical protein
MLCSPVSTQQKNPKKNMSRLFKIQALGIPLESFKKNSIDQIEERI